MCALKWALALSCQQGITADLPLAFNRHFSTGFSSATPAAAEKSLLGFNSTSDKRGVEFISQSFCHFSTSWMKCSHCQTKCCVVLLDAVCNHNVLTHDCGVDLFVLWDLCGWAHVIVAAAVCSHTWLTSDPLLHILRGMLMMFTEDWKSAVTQRTPKLKHSPLPNHMHKNSCSYEFSMYNSMLVALAMQFHTGVLFLWVV